MARQCPRMKHRNSESKPTVTDQNKILHTDSCSNSHAKYFKNGVLNGHPVKCYIDMGSGVTLIRESDAREIKVDWQYGKKNRRVIGYGQGIVQPIGEFRGTLEIDGVHGEIEFLVVPDNSQTIPVLVGHQYTELPNIRIISDAKGLTIVSEVCVESEVAATPSAKVELWSAEATVIPNNYIGHVNVHATTENQNLWIENRIRENGEMIPRCIIKLDDHGDAVVPIVNFTGAEIVISENQNITRGEICLAAEQADPEVMPVSVRGVDTSKRVVTAEDLNTELDQDDVEQLEGTLNEYSDLIAFDLYSLGKTNKAEMSITLKDDVPVYYRPYRLSQFERDKVKKMVDELKGADIIEDSTSPYASPIVLVKKRNGDFRMCIDYRALNSKTVKDHFPLPLIDDQLDRLHGQVYFTTLDLASGYYQVPMADDAKEKTAFITPDGHYQFRRMPFGLCNSPAVFQRLIHKVLGNFRYSIAMAYLDDIVIPSKTVQEGMENLKAVIDCIREAGLTLNLSKCRFFQRKIEYLGFEISAEGIEPGKRKLACLENFPIPSNVKYVRSFVGLCSYFRRFIKDFATLARPLTDLLKTDVDFEWGDSQLESFNIIKSRLMQKPVLAMFNPSAQTEVHTDASSLGLGAVIYQEQEDRSYKPIGFYSRKTSREESKYSSIELEALAVVTALEKFRVYLLGKHFIVRTDCNSLKLLANKRSMSARIARWFLRVSEFDFTVEYMQGKANQVADALSRYTTEECSQDESKSDVFCLSVDINTDWVAAMQRADEKILQIRDRLEQGDEETHSKFSMYNCRVYKYTKYRWRLYVPECLWFDIVRDAHEDVAHMGVDKTLSKLKKSYYFPKMRDFVSQYIHRCIKCIYFKTPTGKKPGILHPLEKGCRPFTTIHIDHVGPYVTTKRKNRYIIVLVDGFSKFVVLAAVKDVASTETITFVKSFISTFGKPDRIVTDRGSAFTSKQFEKVCDDYDIYHVKVASGCPRANGQVERVNKTVTSSLAMLSTEEEGRDWDENILEVQLALNNSVHRITKKTPAEIVFSYNVKTVHDNPLIQEIADVNEEQGVESESINVSELLEKNREVQRHQFNKHRRVADELLPGDIVMLISDSGQATGDSRKLLPKCKGPYEVVKLIGNDRYLVEDIEGEQQTHRIFKAIVARDRLKFVKRPETI